MGAFYFGGNLINLITAKALGYAMISIEQQIEQVLEHVRPALRMDGGGIELVKYDANTGTVHVRMRGACAGCPMSQITLKMGVEAALQDAIPEVTAVIAIDSDEHESNA